MLAASVSDVADWVVIVGTVVGAVLCPGGTPISQEPRTFD